MWLELHDSNGRSDTVTHFQRVEGKRRTTLVTFAHNNGTCAMFRFTSHPTRFWSCSANINAVWPDLVEASPDFEASRFPEASSLQTPLN